MLVPLTHVLEKLAAVERSALSNEADLLEPSQSPSAAPSVLKWGEEYAAPDDPSEPLERQFYEVLAAGELSAYTYRQGESLLYRIDSSYWDSDGWWRERLTDQLFEFDRLPGFADAPVFFEQAEVAAFVERIEHGAEGVARSTEVEQGRTGDPGRTELGAVLYLAEFKRRVASGLAKERLTDEAEALLTWFAASYPSRQTPTTGTIKNRIRALHREYRDHIAT